LTSAAEIEPNNAGAVFELCWREFPDPEEISREILNDNPALIRQYVDFLFAKDQFSAAAAAAQRLVRYGDSRTDATPLLKAINRLVAAKDVPAARALWRALIDRHWIVADATMINNPNFARNPLPVSFDWNLPSYDGLHSWPGPAGLESEFTGIEPETCIVAEQSVVLAPGKYGLEYIYRTSQIPPATGLRWQIVDAASDTPLATSPDLSSAVLQSSRFEFSVPEGASLLEIRLAYQRAIGTTRISGRLVIRSVQIVPGL
jgi:hypothetical protein